MAYRKQLLEVSYHYDTDTGMYDVGEIDFAISGELDNYLKEYGSKGLDKILLTLDHLIWHTIQYGTAIVKPMEQGSIAQVNIKNLK